MFISFDGKTYNTGDGPQMKALGEAIEGCKEAWKLQQAITSLRFQVFGNDVAGQVVGFMEQQLQKLTAPQVQFNQGFIFRDDRPKCAVCTSPLEVSQYGTGHHWFSDSCYSAFICGACASKDRSSIKTCSTSGCGGLYWAKTVFSTCADCFFIQKYQGLATNKAITLPLQLNTPQFHAGTQAETLFRNYVKRVTDIDSITVSSNNGIDLVFITDGDAEYSALWDCIVGTVQVDPLFVPQRKSSRKKSSVFSQEKGPVIHYCEVKVNGAQCSKAQGKAQDFVEDRLKNALKGQYGEKARQGAQAVEKAMRKGADFELHLIRVSMPRTGTEEYQRGDAITAVRYPWGETGGRAGETKVLLEHCNSITYMDSAWIGDTGEEIAKRFLEELGFKVRGAVQNNTGNGVDLAAKLDATPTSPRWAFFEVKTSTVKFQTKLESAEEEQWMFVMDRCTKALLGIENYVNLNSSPGLQLNPTTWTVSELFWDFQNQEHWAKRALYFQVAVRLPDAGTKDAVQVKLLAWPGPRSQGSKPLKKDPIPTPLFIGYGGSTSSLGSVNVPKVSMQTLSPHPFGGRYDNLHSCFVMGCDCREFKASMLSPQTCGTCGHAHGS